MRYNWQLSDWTHFQYDLSVVYDSLLKIAEKAGFISGKISHIAKDQQMEAMVDLLVEEAVHTSEIEGEYIHRADVRSSIIRKLGLGLNVSLIKDQRAEGIAELMLDVRNSYQEELTEEKLFDWHLMLLGGSRNPNLKVGYWRTDDSAMQIVSGHYGRRVVHFVAPPSKQVPDEMQKFLKWFNETALGKHKAIPFPVVRSAIAHLYFESIHPFDDGNGRIGRAIAEKALSQGFGYPVLISLSTAIEAHKKEYYAALGAASKSNEITAWIVYFVNLVLDAQAYTENQIDFIIKKTNFFDNYNKLLNERQLKVLARMLQAGSKGFEGGMSAKKYMAIAKTSKATATRDLQHLVELHALRQIGSGRSVRYEINLSTIGSVF